MQKPKHTPGPWYVTASCENGTMICSGKPKDKTICLWPDDGGSVENCNNARLIAAAPEMKELLESACSTWRFMMNDLSLSVTERMAAEKKHGEARALLDKIEG